MVQASVKYIFDISVTADIIIVYNYNVCIVCVDKPVAPSCGD